MELNEFDCNSRINLFYRNKGSFVIAVGYMGNIILYVEIYSDDKSIRDSLFK